MPVKELDPELLFERLDLATHGRLRDVELLPRTRETQMARRAFEASQEIQRRQTSQSLCQSHISHTAASKLHPSTDKLPFVSLYRFSYLDSETILS